MGIISSAHSALWEKIYRSTDVEEESLLFLAVKFPTTLFIRITLRKNYAVNQKCFVKLSAKAIHNPSFSHNDLTLKTSPSLVIPQNWSNCSHINTGAVLQTVCSSSKCSCLNVCFICNLLYIAKPTETPSVLMRIYMCIIACVFEHRSGCDKLRRWFADTVPTDWVWSFLGHRFDAHRGLSYRISHSTGQFRN